MTNLLLTETERQVLELVIEDYLEYNKTQSFVPGAANLELARELYRRVLAHRESNRIPFGEPFGQRFVGLLETNKLLRESLEIAGKSFKIEQHRDSVLLTYGIEDQGDYRCIWQTTSLATEFAYVLYRKLRAALYGTPEQDIQPKIKEV